MPDTRIIKSRGAVVAVEAFGETLFLPGSDVARFTRRLSSAVSRAASKNAPVNKRPRWIHYGPPLKRSFTSNSDISAVTKRAYAVAGSRAPHALFVDQGTNDFYAKILPPWTRGGASLYEHTWRPPGSEGNLGKIYVRGQEGQRFFEKGLVEGALSVGLVLRDGLSSIRSQEAFVGIPSRLTELGGMGPWQRMTFGAQLIEWRQWRDRAYNRGAALGKDGKRGAGWYRIKTGQRYSPPRKPRRRATVEEAREQNRLRQEKYRARHREEINADRRRVYKPKRQEKPTRERNTPKTNFEKAKLKDRIRYIDALTRKYPSSEGYRVVDIKFVDGRWTAVVIRPNGDRHPVQSANIIR